MDEETGLYYYGARYLDPRYSRWISTDPALGEYIPKAPIDEEAKRYNQNLPGMGGVFNHINANLYHYAGNNPVRYIDPDGRFPTPKMFYDAFIKVVENFSIPSKDEHYSRNNSNIDIGTDWTSANKLAEQGQVVKMPETKDLYHEQGSASDYNPQMNDKFVSLDGTSETVYNRETGQKITDPVNQGTYNRADPNSNSVGHFFQDMIPYYIWGNSEDDPTNAWERITGSYQGNVNATKEEASRYRAQMNEEKINKAMEQYYEHH
ncbi:RHS repeat-associated core domain-containing protein [uncultured Treponema sp.]|uniref:RHS repeat-associated core domain-containing protein n=1 Tax=uncultured Treponema sp. TaxID=162155 RepID=UPI00280BCF47|nr:RHS repeat-associated core domain-containing protein [uncultured Treponema sp.]